MDSEYRSFHQIPRIQKKVISKNNFTYRNVISVLDVYIGSNKLDILDFGCGVGTLDFYLASKGHNVWGVDVSPIALRVGRESAKVMHLDNRVMFRFINQKLHMKFDLIICSEVIEHVENDTELVNNLAGQLKQDGVLVISTPSRNAPLFKLGLSKKFDSSVGHLRRYDETKLKKIAGKCGLKVIAIEKTEGILRNSLFLFNSLNFFVKFIKGPISDLVTFVDKIFLSLFGESDIIIVCSKR